MTTILYARGIGAFVDLPDGMTSGHYQALEDKFIRAAGFHPRSGRDEDKPWVRHMDVDHTKKKGEIYWDEGVASASGFWFLLFAMPGVTREEIAALSWKIRSQHDVVRLSVVRLAKIIPLSFSLEEGEAETIRAKTWGDIKKESQNDKAKTKIHRQS